MEVRLGYEHLLAEPSGAKPLGRLVPWCQSVRVLACALLGLSLGGFALFYSQEVNTTLDVDADAATLALSAFQQPRSSTHVRSQYRVQPMPSSSIFASPIHKRHVDAVSPSRVTVARVQTATESDAKPETKSVLDAKTLKALERQYGANAKKAKTDAAKIQEWEQKMVVNEAAMLAESTFPIKPEELIMKAKLVLAFDMGVSNPDLLATDFEFVGPVVGPLGKDTYLKAVGGFKLLDSFPDFNSEFHHFRVDPFEPSRVWFTARGYGTNTGKGDSPLFGEPTGKKYVNPPQACSLRFDPDGKVNQYTIGYVMDRRIGNTGGLGGVYGLAYAMGKPLPFPEAQPWKPSKRYRFFSWLGSVAQKMNSKKENA